MLAIKGSRIAAILMLLMVNWSWSQIPQVSAAGDFDSLYSAIRAANAGGESAITLTEDITLSGALPPITGKLTIDGDGHSISGNKQYRIFEVSGGRLGISDLTLTEGKAPASEDGGAILLRSGGEAIVSDAAFINNEAENGGALYLNYASAAIANSSFAGNRTHPLRGYGGAVNAQNSRITIARSSFVANRSGSSGGAIVARDSVINITNSTFHKNRTDFGGGVLTALASDATLTHLTMVSNWARSERGDAISRVGGSVKLRNSIIVDGGIKEDCVGGLSQSIGNLSHDGTCGLDASDDPRLDGPVGSPVWFPLLDRSPAVDTANPEYCLETDQIGTLRPQGGSCDIGAIESMTASAALPTPVPPLVCTLSDQIKAANTDAEAGICPAGNGADIITLTKDHNLQAPLPRINSHITIEGNGYTISGDKKYRVFRVDGGKLTINNLTLSDGFAKELGGAIRLQGESELVANASRFLSNSAKDGGAIASNSEVSRVYINKSSFVGNRASSGGGAIMMLNGGDLSVTDSSFVENAANAKNGHGGAINDSCANTVDISSSTFIGNRAFRGGAVSAGCASAVTLTHVTLLNNQASLGAGLWIAENGRNTVKLRNSIIAGGIRRNCQGPLAQNTGNLIDDASCSPMLSGDPMLAQPAGDPVYLPLQAGSPAIGAADPRYCLPEDQLGTARPQGSGCDIGAIEWSAGGAADAGTSSDTLDLSGCNVTTTHVLNFRDGPGGGRIGLVREGAELLVAGKAPGWFQVEYRGRTGWISADYVVAEGDCG